jgi:hypothetical protein
MPNTRRGIDRRIVGGLGAVVVALVAAVVVWNARHSALTGERGSKEGKAAPSTHASTGSDAVLSIRPGISPPASRTQPVTHVTPLMREFFEARNYRALYDRLEARGTARTPEESYLLSRILERCVNGLAPNRPQAATNEINDEKRRALESALSPRDPAREKRLAAFDRLRNDVCEGLGGLPDAHKEARALVESAAAAGEPAAQARLVQIQLHDQLALPDGSTRATSRPQDFPEISDAQVETLRRSVASGDPLAVMVAVDALNSPMSNLSLRTDDDRPMSADALRSAAHLMACDLGYPCGPEDRELTAGCAVLGKCDATSYRDWLFFYARSPADSQVTQDYYDRLTRAAATGDWSSITFARAPNPLWTAYPAF